VNISIRLMPRVSPHSGMENRRMAQETGQKSAFAKYLDVDRQRRLMREPPPDRGLSSVYMQFLADYRDWKTGRAIGGFFGPFVRPKSGDH